MKKWPMSVFNALKRWERDKTKLDYRADNGSHMKKKQKLQGRIQDYLLSKQTLDDWSGLGLETRCILLDSAKGIKVSWQVLRNFYIRHGVKYLFSNYAYQQSLAVKRSAILDFALELAQLIQDDKVLIYFDETTLNMWMRGRKTW